MVSQSGPEAASRASGTPLLTPSNPTPLGPHFGLQDTTSPTTRRTDLRRWHISADHMMTMCSRTGTQRQNQWKHY
eukprot:1904320-Prorocentrum_lima.AAC.1